MWLLSGFYGSCKPISCGEQELVHLLPFQAENHYVLCLFFCGVFCRTPPGFLVNHALFDDPLQTVYHLHPFFFRR